MADGKPTTAAQACIQYCRQQLEESNHDDRTNIIEACNSSRADDGGWSRVLCAHHSRYLSRHHGRLARSHAHLQHQGVLQGQVVPSVDEQLVLEVLRRVEVLAGRLLSVAPALKSSERQKIRVNRTAVMSSYLVPIQFSS